MIVYQVLEHISILNDSPINIVIYREHGRGREELYNTIITDTRDAISWRCNLSGDIFNLKVKDCFTYLFYSHIKLVIYVS